ncbi:MAG: spore coat protein YsxE, partial [Sporolactobacillus sp.]
MVDQDLLVQRLLFQYDLNPYQFSKQGNVIKVETIIGNFALKEKPMTRNQLSHLLTAYQLASGLAIDALTPLPSKYGDLVIQGDGDIGHYLLPWFEETVPSSDLLTRYSRLFLKAGQMHHQTMKGDDDPEPLYQSMLQFLGYRQSIWENFVLQAEHHVYPSPFEQLVLSSAGGYLTNIQRSLTYFQDALKNEEETENPAKKGLRRALCHGRLNPLHLVIENEKCYLINFEECSYGLFIIEAAALFEQASAVLTRPHLPWKEWVASYLHACPLTENETAFLFHYIICPRIPSK